VAVALALTVLPSGVHQSRDFRLGQVLTAAQSGVLRLLGSLDCALFEGWRLKSYDRIH